MLTPRDVFSCQQAIAGGAIRSHENKIEIMSPVQFGDADVRDPLNLSEVVRSKVTVGLLRSYL